MISVLILSFVWLSFTLLVWCHSVCFFFFQAEDGIRDLVRSRGLGDVYKRQVWGGSPAGAAEDPGGDGGERAAAGRPQAPPPGVLSLIHI